VRAEADQGILCKLMRDGTVANFFEVEFNFCMLSYMGKFRAFRHRFNCHNAALDQLKQPLMNARGIVFYILYVAKKDLRQSHSWPAQ
jgi:hypothetical protein